MISFLIKHKTIILIITLAFFIGSLGYLGVGAYRRSNMTAAAAKVGSHTISYRQLYNLSEHRARTLRDQGVDVDDNMLKFLNQQLLAALISEEILVQAAQKAGLAVSDYEVAYDIRTSPLLAGAAFDKQRYQAVVRQATGMQPSEFEEQLRRGKLADRFRTVLYSNYKLTPEEIKHAYQAQHGNMKDFEQNKRDFAAQLLDTKMETAQSAFFDDFNASVEVKTFLKD